jgi:Trp operon repressor
MNIPEVRWLNLEYFFYKIYDFFGGIFGSSSSIGQSSSITSSQGGGLGQWLTSTFGTLGPVAVIIFLIVLIVLFSTIIYTRMHMYEIEQKHREKYDNHFITPPAKIEEKKNARWENVLQLFSSANSNDWRVAIIEADTMLDELVQSYNFAGENLGERLKNANTKIMPTVQSAWEAHKVRNRIAHDGINYNLSQREAQLTKRHYEFVFKDSGII